MSSSLNEERRIRRQALEDALATVCSCSTEPWAPCSSSATSPPTISAAPPSKAAMKTSSSRVPTSSPMSTAPTTKPAPTSSRPTASAAPASSWPNTICEAQAYELNFAAAETCPPRPPTSSPRPAEPRFVAGSMGPTTKAITVTGGVTFPELDRQLLLHRRKGWWKAAPTSCCSKPARIRATSKPACWRSSKLGARTRPHNSHHGLRHHRTPRAPCSPAKPPTLSMPPSRTPNLLSIGLNCATGPEFMTDHIRSLHELATTRISCYPNAGLPDEEGKYLRDARLRSPLSSNDSSITAGSISSAAAAAPRPLTSGHRADGRRQERRAQPKQSIAPHLLLRHRTGRSRRQQPPADRRRAHQRHRLAPLQEHDRRGKVGRGHRNRPLADPQRRARHRCLPAIERSRRNATTFRRSTKS